LQSTNFGLLKFFRILCKTQILDLNKTLLDNWCKHKDYQSLNKNLEFHPKLIVSSY